MSIPRYPATIEFPAKFLDREVQEMLETEYRIRFQEPDPREPDHELELAEQDFEEIDVKFRQGIFHFYDPEARYGEFNELEELLAKKGIPFDRDSGMDWNSPPAIRIFRPPAFDYTDSTPDVYEKVASVADLRELLPADGAEMDAGRCCEAVTAIKEYLEARFPSYPPLTDYVG